MNPSHSQRAEKLGFSQVLEDIRPYCKGDLGQAQLEALEVSFAYEEVHFRQSLLMELKVVFDLGVFTPERYFSDVRLFHRQLITPGAILEIEDWAALRGFLQTLGRIVELIDTHRDNMPSWLRLRNEVFFEGAWVQSINKVLDQEGRMRDDASYELYALRKELTEVKQQLRRDLDRILKAFVREGYTEEDTLPTIRNGRMVLSVRSEYKRQIKGFIHDESATGLHTYIEPAQVLELNNLIKDLEYQERREIVKILEALGQQLHFIAPHLENAMTLSGRFDLCRACLRWAEKQEGHPLLPQKLVASQWQGAVHPMLRKKLIEAQKPYRKLTLGLQETQRIMLISGPNAGGKSVALKTYGLLQWMYQCGLPVTVDEGSLPGVFSDIFIEVGDGQSIENDLSTYSAHLAALKEMVVKANAHTLVLVDELGSGTEPQAGAALAEAFLEAIVAAGAWGVLTTHFSNLKEAAQRLPAVVNAAMSYDPEKHKPGFVLEVGRPGSSYALDIARRTGFPETFLNRTTALLGADYVRYENLLQSMEVLSEEMRAKQEEIRIQEGLLKEQLKRYQELNLELTAFKKEKQNEAKQEAKSIIEEANARIERTIREIKEAGAEKEQTKIIRQALKTYSETLEPELTPEVKSVEAEGPIRSGDYVLIKDRKVYAIVESIKGDEIEIRMGSLSSTLKVQRLQKVTRKEYLKHTGEEMGTSGSGRMVLENQMQFKATLDIRGKRWEEAEGEIIAWLDQALLSGIREISLLHGKGNGILRQRSRELLRSFPGIHDFNDAHADRGGAGITIIYLTA